MASASKVAIVLMAAICGLLPVGAALFVAGAFMLGEYPSTTTVVTARTQTLTYELVPQRPYVWRLPPGSFSWISERLGGDDQRSVPTESSLELQQLQVCGPEVDDSCPDGQRGAIRIVQTLDDTGRMAMSWILGSAGQGFSRATLFAEGTTEKLGGLLRIEYESEHPLGTYQSVHLVRNAELGRLISAHTVDHSGTGSQPSLLDGDVSFFARTLGSQDRYLVQRAILSPGDVVFVGEEASDTRAWAQITYFPATDDHPVLTALVRAATDQARITQNQAGTGFLVGTSPFKILSREPLVTTLWGVLVFLLLLLGTIPSLQAYLTEDPKKVERPPGPLFSVRVPRRRRRMPPFRQGGVP